MIDLDDLRESSPDGSLPASVAPGGPLTYLTREGLTLCSTCASSPDQHDPPVAALVHMSGPDEICDSCGAAIPSAYGEPDEPAAPIHDRAGPEHTHRPCQEAHDRSTLWSRIAHCEGCGLPLAPDDPREPRPTR
jgi:hypothetical protein